MPPSVEYRWGRLNCAGSTVRPVGVRASVARGLRSQLSHTIRRERRHPVTPVRTERGPAETVTRRSGATADTTRQPLPEQRPVSVVEYPSPRLEDRLTPHRSYTVPGNVCQTEAGCAISGTICQNGDADRSSVRLAECDQIRLTLTGVQSGWQSVIRSD